MLIFIFLSLFSVLINCNLLSYNENFILCIFFIIFFNLIYTLTNKNFKEYNFFRIFKVYYLLFFVLRVNYYFYKLLIYFYYIKCNVLKKIIIKINLIKKNLLLSVNSIFENYLVLFNLIFFLSINKIYKLINNLSNYLVVKFIDKFLFYDSILFQ